MGKLLGRTHNFVWIWGEKGSSIETILPTPTPRHPRHIPTPPLPRWVRWSLFPQQFIVHEGFYIQSGRRQLHFSRCQCPLVCRLHRAWLSWRPGGCGGRSSFVLLFWVGETCRSFREGPARRFVLDWSLKAGPPWRAVFCKKHVNFYSPNRKYATRWRIGESNKRPAPLCVAQIISMMTLTTVVKDGKDDIKLRAWAEADNQLILQ